MVQDLHTQKYHMKENADGRSTIKTRKRKAPCKMTTMQTENNTSVMPHKRHTRHEVEALAESFILLDSLLFKLVTILNKEKALLAIPENFADKIIELYHTSLFTGH